MIIFYESYFMNILDIKSKKDLIDYISLHVTATYKQLKDDQKLEYEKNLLKTYLVEQDIKNKKNLIEYFENYFVLENKTGEIKPTINFIEDEFYIIDYKSVGCLFVDVADERIWNIYSLLNSEDSQEIISKVTNSIYFDNMWLYHEILYKLLKDDSKSLRGFGLSFDDKKFEKKDTELNEQFKMQLSTFSYSKKVFESLYEIPEIKKNISLSKVKIKTGDYLLDSVLEEIQFYGKITVRGSNFIRHLSNTKTLKDIYITVLKSIESKYRDNYSIITDKLVNNISPIYFLKRNQDKDPIDVDFICNKVFDGKNPFKLLGFSEKISGGKSVRVFDLHIGSVFHVKIYPDMFVFYLNRNVCGNTVLRFYTNLQHYYSNSFDVVDDYGNKVLQI